VATVNDVDTGGLVEKYLDRQVVTPRLDQSANSGDEVAAVLEAVAITLLLYPQAALALILRSKNTLQQLVQQDIGLIDFITQAIDDINNPDDPVTDSSDLIEAQTALVELDRLGKVGQGVQAYDRYNAAINRFLDEKLARSLKRHARLRDGVHEFERSGTEAKQDVFQALTLFGAAHSAVIQRRKELQGSVADFQSVDLTRVVSGRTLARVRSSLQQIIRGIAQQNLSKTVMALELLAGAASLKSISNIREVYDPLVDTLGMKPDGRTIVADTVPVAATALSSPGPWTLGGTPWNFSLAVDGGSVGTIELPSTGASGRVFLTSTAGSGTYAIQPIGGLDPKLYVRVEEGATITDLTINLTTGGAVTFAQLVADINAGMGVKGTCQELYTGANRFIIFGAGTVTRLTIISAFPGVVDGGGTYNAPNPSANLTLGFQDNQRSAALGVFSAASVKDLLEGQISSVSMSVEDTSLRITSNLVSFTSKLVFSGAVAQVFGFGATYECEPTALYLREKGQPVDAASLNILEGSLVVAAEVGPGTRALSAVTTPNGDALTFLPSIPLPRGVGLNVVVTSAMANLMQKLLQQLGLLASMESDFFNLQKVLSPILARPTLAQINDAKRVLADIRAKLTGANLNPAQTGLLEALSGAVIPDSQVNFRSTADTIITSLEERGLDRAEDLLKRGLFSQFFALTREAASRSGRFLSAMEDIGRTDVASTTIEADLPDGNPVQGTGPEQTLQGKEPAT